MGNDLSASALADVLYALTGPVPATVGDPQPYQWATIEPGGGPAAPDARTPGPHWAGAVVRALLDRALAADPAGAPAQLVVNKLDLGTFVDDLCGTPATWPVPLPLPGGARWWPDRCLAGGALPATDLLVAGAHLHRAADRLPGDHPVRTDLMAAADRLFETGLSRLNEQAKIEAKHEAEIEAKHEAEIGAKHEAEIGAKHEAERGTLEAKHESAVSGLEQTGIVLAKHR